MLEHDPSKEDIAASRRWLTTQPETTPEQEDLITDLLFRERVAEINPWISYGLSLVVVITVPVMFWRVVSGWWIAIWELLWIGTVVGWRFAMRIYYRRHYPYPRRPHNRRFWKLLRHGYQIWFWFVYGLLALFCFVPGTIEWQILAVTGLLLSYVTASNYMTERTEMLVCALTLPWPTVYLLIRGGSSLQLAMAVFFLGFLSSITVWGMYLIKARRNEIYLRIRLFEERRRAEEANIAKSKFLAAASHDLRQPVHALTLFVAMLRERIQFPEVRSLVDNAARSVEALDGLFQALLDVSRLDAGIVQPKIGDFRIAPLFTRLITEYQAQATSKNLRLSSDYPDATVRSDPALLELILRNLLSNAIRYTARGEVVLRASSTDAGLRIEVVDTGIGIPADKHKEIFREFVQLGNPERDRSKGLGLGLAIVNRVAALLQHPVDVRSKPGEGSCFSILVPYGESSSIEETSASMPSSVGIAIEGLTVVVIDDEPAIRDGMQGILTGWGCTAVTAASADEARDTLHARQLMPDIIIADYRLRDEKTGAQAIETLRREFGTNLPGIIITGDTAPERLREASTSGFVLMHKPVAPAKLRSTLHRLHRRS